MNLFNYVSVIPNCITKDLMFNNMFKNFNNLQIAEIDNDMIGICQSLTNFMTHIVNYIGIDNLPDITKPDNFYKLNPHLPRIELRESYRGMLAYAVKNQLEEDEIIKLANIYVCLMAGILVYHMPLDAMVEQSKKGVEITRDEAREMLLQDDMSPNWIKEPSGSDYSAIML